MLEIEEKIMDRIGLGMNYRWFNGSGSCEYIRDQAIDRLVNVMSEYELYPSKEWLDACKEASLADMIDGGKYTLTNTWVAISNTLRDASERKNNGTGFKPDYSRFQFFTQESRSKYNEMRAFNRRFKLRGDYGAS
jgi:hypothetical protein